MSGGQGLMQQGGSGGNMFGLSSAQPNPASDVGMVAPTQQTNSFSSDPSPFLQQNQQQMSVGNQQNLNNAMQAFSQQNQQKMPFGNQQNVNNAMQGIMGLINNLPQQNNVTANATPNGPAPLSSGNAYATPQTTPFSSGGGNAYAQSGGTGYGSGYSGQSSSPYGHNK